MVTFVATIQRFEAKGGWTYVIVPATVAEKLKRGNRQSFRVKGHLDQLPVKSLAVMPMGNGKFMIPLNAKLRKGFGKSAGAKLRLALTEDKAPRRYDTDLLLCLNEEPGAKAFFQSMSKSNQWYYSHWVATAKTDATKAKRIARCIAALLRKQHYGQMLQWEKESGS